MKKPDEIELMRAVLDWDQRGKRERILELPEIAHMPDKRVYGLIAKWDRKGWWDYGVSLLCGWLTDKGRTALKEMVAKYEGG